MRGRLFIMGIVCLICCPNSWSQSPIRNTLHIQITGLPEIASKNVNTRLETKENLIKNNFTEINVRKLYKSVPREIKAGLAPYGYFKPKIISTLRFANNVWQGNFNVDPGPRMKYTTVELQITGPGTTEKKFQRLSRAFPLKPGDYFNTDNYQDAKSGLMDLASSKGFFRAKMKESKILINLKEYTSQVIFKLDTGPRFRFGPTRFSKGPLDQRFLKRFLRYTQGDFYDYKFIKRTRNDMSSTPYFSSVIITPDAQKAKNLMVPVRIKTRMFPRKQYNLGVGYGSDTGIRGMVGVDIRWVNPEGHRFNAIARGSTYASELSGNYIIPGRHPAQDQYIFNGGLLYQNQDTGTGTSARISAGYQTLFNKWVFRITLTELYEKYNITGFPRTDANLLYPTLSFSRVKADDRLNPNKGYNVLAQVLAASNAVLSKTNLVQPRLDARFLFTLFNTTRFLARTSFGYTDINNLNNLPLSLQFFAGGPQSLRGFSYNSIGPGRYLFVNSVEIQQKIYKSFYVTGFWDFGTVANSLFHGQKLFEDAGPGLALLTPIGMFELTLANAFQSPISTKKPWVIQFVMGTPL